MTHVNCPHCQHVVRIEILKSGCFSGRCDYCKSGVLAGPGDRPASLVKEALSVVAEENVRSKDKVR